MLQTPTYSPFHLMSTVVNPESEGLGTIHVLSAGHTYRGPMYIPGNIISHDDKYRYLNRISYFTSFLGWFYV